MDEGPKVGGVNFGRPLRVNGCLEREIGFQYEREDEFSYALNSTDTVALGLKVMAGFAL